MGVYIKGMKMPNDCDHCPFIFYDADVNERAWCEAVKPYGIDVTDCQGKRHSNCPLVELPPHGLIDKQMLLRNIADNQFAHSSVGHEEDYAFWGKVWVYIFDAPTIIEKVFYRDKGDNSMCRELREAEGEDDNTE